MILDKYSFGIGDRFGQQGAAQLKAFIQAQEQGIEVIPVWNKSNREHIIIQSSPADTRKEAENAVKTCGWEKDYFVDADHINLYTVDGYIEDCNFFTIDVAEQIGQYTGETERNNFIKKNQELPGEIFIPGFADSIKITPHLLSGFAGKFLFALKHAARIYERIVEKKGSENFITEVSMDEVSEAQTAIELLLILLTLADYKIPLQTIAPRFSGKFYKGIDFVGNVNQFSEEFESFIFIIDYAIKEFGLPDNLKLSIHSGSDKFSIYPKINDVIHRHNKGIHVKTAGTTWLEEFTGLIMSGKKGLEVAKSIYSDSFKKINELCNPYASVIKIDETQLPTINEVKTWSVEKFANSLINNKNNPDYNPHLRQFIHISYKIAAEYGSRFIDALEENSNIINKRVTDNIFKNHLVPLFKIKSDT